MVVRPPAVAGQFYSADKAALAKEVARLTDPAAKREECLGAVSPHAGYIYSGPVAGKTLSRVAFKDSFIVMGPNHTGIGKPFSIMSKGSFKTPLGEVKIDTELAEAILKGSRRMEEDASAHGYEHSVEVQLPFLQQAGGAITFVPIVIAEQAIGELKAAGRDLAAAIKGWGRRAVVISSSDMTHYESDRSAREKDKKAIDAILALDEDRLMKEIIERDISMCGFAPTIVMLSALKELGAKKAELVDYKTSGDASGDYTSVVGYAGIIIK
jgi:AmmeMemoRadiSam system protein B